MALLAVTPLSTVYLRGIAGLPERLSSFVTPALLLAVPLPFINSIHSWLRGLLLNARMTTVIYWGMGLNLGLTTLLMIAGVLIQSPSAGTAVTALTAAFLAEVYYLRRAGGALFR